MKHFLSKAPLYFAILCLALMITLTGCAVMDSLFLPPVDPAGNPTGPSIADSIGAAASNLIPGWGTIASMGLMGAGWLYTHVRGKSKQNAIFGLVANIVQAALAAKGGSFDVDALYETLTDAKTLYTNKDKFVKLVGDIRASMDKYLADGFQPEDVEKIINDVKGDFADINQVGAPAPAVPVASAPSAKVSPADPTAPSPVQEA